MTFRAGALSNEIDLTYSASALSKEISLTFPAGALSKKIDLTFPGNIFICSENLTCLLCLLHLFKCNPEYLTLD